MRQRPISKNSGRPRSVASNASRVQGMNSVEGDKSQDRRVKGCSWFLNQQERHNETDKETLKRTWKGVLLNYATPRSRSSLSDANHDMWAVNTGRNTRQSQAQKRHVTWRLFTRDISPSTSFCALMCLYPILSSMAPHMPYHGLAHFLLPSQSTCDPPRCITVGMCQAVPCFQSSRLEGWRLRCKGAYLEAI